MRWDVFGRVIDNFGDVGVCWRLAADLAARGESVRLWLDDPTALRRLAPDGAPGVEPGDWDRAEHAAAPGDVVIEAFGCDPPAAFVARMAARRPAPRWINLEYLSAEPWVERCHRLPSPQHLGPGQGLTKWFYLPGFTPRTGGLLREPGLLAARGGFDRDAWLAARGWQRRPGERVVLVFCYDNPALPHGLEALAGAPTLVLLAAGPAQQIAAAVPPLDGQRRIALPWLSQTEFDRALWSADLNLVRGEDSFVRAQWAAAPFVWQIYPQRDGAHVPKLHAFVDRFTAVAGALPPAAAALWQAWNGLAQWDSRVFAAALDEGTLAPWRRAVGRWRDALAAQDDLVTQLLRFVAEKG